MKFLFCFVTGLILSFLLLLLPLGLTAQTTTEDVLYLKNGWVLRGKLLPESAPQKVALQTADRNVFVFDRSEITEIRQEPYVPVRATAVYKPKGFFHFTELGALAARNTDQDNVNTSAFSFQTVNGYKFGPLAYLGGGVGIDLYATQTFIPLFASYRGDLVRRGTVIPYYFVDGGYGLNTTRNDNPNREFYGGFLFCSGVGIKAIFGNNTGFLISVGYRLQQSAIEETGPAGTDRQELNYNRLALRAGFTF